MPTPAPQMEANPLQRALDNYLVMEMERDAARHEAAQIRTENARLVAEVTMLRDQLRTTDTDRRKWEATCSTLFGRLLAINDTIAGAVKQAARDGLEARDEPTEADAARVAATQCVGAEEATEEPPIEKTSPAPPQRVLASVPRNEFRR